MERTHGAVAGVQRCMRMSVAPLVGVSLLSSLHLWWRERRYRQVIPGGADPSLVSGCDETVWGRLEHGYRAESTNVDPLTFVRLPRLAANRREIRAGSKGYPIKCSSPSSKVIAP
jgi:hypothetical protein